VLARADAFDDALAQVGLSKDTARFNLLDLQNYGGVYWEIDLVTC
jgi:hypothetical protein